MVEMVAPKPGDVLCDPACGTAGFLVAAGEYLREQHPEIFRDAKLSRHFHQDFFHGFDARQSAGPGVSRHRHA
jgi:type I restriction enzyme M protein